jgi:hypothetical protein
MKTAKAVTVLLAEDHTIVREGLRKLLDAESDIEVVGEASTGRQAVEMARKLFVPMWSSWTSPCRASTAWKPPARFSRPSLMPKCSFFPRTATKPMSRASRLGAAGYLIKQTSFRFSRRGDTGSQQREDILQPLHWEGASPSPSEMDRSQGKRTKAMSI